MPESKRISTRTLNDVMQELNDTHKLIHCLYQQMEAVIDELKDIPHTSIHVHIIVNDEIDSTNRRIQELKQLIQKLEYYRDSMKSESPTS